MPDITVPREDRPSVGRYIGYTAVGWIVVAVLVGGTIQNVRSPVVVFGLSLVAGLVNVAILFAMVEALVSAWFNAAVVSEE